MQRRELLGAGAGLSAALLSAGCLGANGLRETLAGEDAWRELVVDPPDGVYVPSKVDAMIDYGSATVGKYDVALLASRPHSFWTVTGGEPTRATLRPAHSSHLMVRLRDAKTGLAVPSSVAIAVRDDDGEYVAERTLWPMLSQRMGVHYGDNVALDGGGEYVAELRIDPVEIQTTGAFADRFASRRTLEVPFSFDPAEIENLERTLVDADEGRGARGAVPPMRAAREPDDRPPLSTAGDHRGALAGSAVGDDIRYRVVAKTDGVVVCPRSRYNGFVLPSMSLSATVPASSDRTVDLEERLDPTDGHHYAAESFALEAGDELEITVDAGPQLARHEGYETAFFEARPVRVPLERRTRWS